MNKKLLLGSTLFLSLALMGNTAIFAATTTNADTDTNNGESVSAQHRNNVGKIVQDLEEIASKDKSVENEVKSVAKEEKDAVDEVSAKMNEVEKRGGFKTFLIGSDYKNLGALRSELVKTQNHIDRLTKSLERTASSTMTDLKTQISELQKVASTAEKFIKDQEGKFSLFGWLTKIFSK
jgi:type VI protein secretion system component VasK